MNILVTGARGFLGRNLLIRLQAIAGFSVIPFDTDNTTTELRSALASADFVFHLAGVNRPQNPRDFETGNAGLTREICALLRQMGRAPTIVMSSSVQAALDNDYGVSKRHAEDALREFALQTGARVRIYRLKNIFGKWCRPNYNSVVATFCYNIANEMPIRISDTNCEIELVAVDDVIESFLAELGPATGPETVHEIPSCKLTLGELAGRIQAFHEMRTTLLHPDLACRFNQQLYGTYLSYVPEEARRQQLDVKSDTRGSLAEFAKGAAFGQLFFSRTRPGVTRGNHYHHTKAEKFLVVEGQAVIRMRQIEATTAAQYHVDGCSPQVVDIPPGYTHSIENVGAGDMVAVFWASEVFNPDCPDTYFLPVLGHSPSAAMVSA